jgi:hypothetical protein
MELDCVYRVDTLHRIRSSSSVSRHSFRRSNRIEPTLERVLILTVAVNFCWNFTEFVCTGNVSILRCFSTPIPVQCHNYFAYRGVAKACPTPIVLGTLSLMSGVMLSTKIYSLSKD